MIFLAALVVVAMGYMAISLSNSLKPKKELTEAEKEIQVIEKQSKSDEITEIEKDLNETELIDIDKELQDIEEELEVE